MEFIVKIIKTIIVEIAYFIASFIEFILLGIIFLLLLGLVGFFVMSLPAPWNLVSGAVGLSLIFVLSAYLPNINNWREKRKEKFRYGIFLSRKLSK